MLAELQLYAGVVPRVYGLDLNPIPLNPKRLNPGMRTCLAPGFPTNANTVGESLFVATSLHREGRFGNMSTASLSSRGS